MNWQVFCSYHNHTNNIPEACPKIHVDQLHHCKDSFDIVFLLSAFIPYSSKLNPDRKYIDTNVVLPLHISELFKSAKLIFASSVAVYGEPQGIIVEETGFNNPDLYGLSKISGEFIIRHHPCYAILRFSSLYGEGMKKSTFLPSIVRDAQQSNAITLFGKGERLQDYLHVRDAAQYCINAALYGSNDIFLGVYGASYSNREVAEMVQKNVKGSCEIFFKGADSSPSFIYDNRFSRLKLGCVPKYSLQEGIRELF